MGNPTPKPPERQDPTHPPLPSHPASRASVLEAALAYALLSWSIIPIAAGTKKPPLGFKWSKYQTTYPTEENLREWFANGKNGLAVIFGGASGGLVCRDFDTIESYEQWATAHPDLAATLPTVATARGFHVYFRTGPDDLIFVDLRRMDPPEDGEYRGDSGHYCLLPPSQHPSGPQYKWRVPLPTGPIPFVDDVRAAGLLSALPPVTERAQRTQSTEDNGSNKEGEGCVEQAPRSPLNCPVLSVTLGEEKNGSDAEIERAIRDTIPRAIGQRNRQVFELARALKGIPRLVDAPVDAMKPHVRRWHRIGLEKGVIGTEPFDETWIDFINGWPKVKFPKGSAPLDEILKRAKASPPPAVAQNYEGAELRLLVVLCRELQRASGGKSFFLACRTAARLLELSEETGYVKAWRWLGLLVHNHVLDLVEPGQPGRRRAARYRYLAD